jgi:ABC-type branched-subunit amino acid transport system permease subunit
MTDQWDFVIAAYVLTALLTAAVLGFSWRAMRRAEARADAVMRERT